MTVRMLLDILKAVPPQTEVWYDSDEQGCLKPDVFVGTIGVQSNGTLCYIDGDDPGEYRQKRQAVVLANREDR